MEEKTSYGAIAHNKIVMMRAQGETFEDIAKSLGVSLRTMKAWFDKHKDLKEAAKLANMFVEQAAEHALLQLALGHFQPETKVFMYQGEVIKEEITKWHSPNPKALEFLLKNVNPEKWKDRHEVSLSSSLPTVSSFDEAKTIISEDPTLLPSAKENE